MKNSSFDLPLYTYIFSEHFVSIAALTNGKLFKTVHSFFCMAQIFNLSKLRLGSSLILILINVRDVKVIKTPAETLPGALVGLRVNLSAHGLSNIWRDVNICVSPETSDSQHHGSRVTLALRFLGCRLHGSLSWEMRH